MTERKSFSGGLQFAWDATSIELAQTCLRKYYYRMIENIVPRSESVHLIFGQIYATALEHFYLHRAQGASIDEALRLVVREALVSSWDQTTAEPRAFDHAAKTRANLIRTIVWYVDQFAEESESGIQTHILSSGRPAVELSFTLEVSDELLFCGHIDRVVNYGGALYWMDQKTTSYTITPRFFDQFKPHNQFYLYTWAGQTILQSPVRGGIIDAAQIAVGFSRFERSPITVTKSQLSEWLESALWTIETARQATALHQFPMNLASCGNYGGCPYRTLCSRCPSVRDKFIEGDYVVADKPWDPLTPR